MGYISLDQVKKYKSEEDSIFSQETINNFSYDEERLKDLDKKINVISEKYKSDTSSYLKNLQVKEKDRENKFARFVGDVSKVSWEVAKSLSKEAVQFPKKFGEEVQKQGGGIGGLTKTTTKLATDMLVGGVKKVGEDLAFYGGKGIHQFINKTDGLGEKQLTQLKNQGYISDISWNPYTNLLIWEENQHAMADSAFEMSKRAKTPELKKKYLAEAQRIRNEILPNAGNKEEAKGLYETKTNAVILDRIRNRTKAQVLADFAEAGLDIATLGIGGKIVKKAGTEAIEQVSKQVLKKGAGEVTEQVGKGILKKAGQETLKEAPSMIAQGVGYGLVGAVQEGETDISNIASSGVVGGVIGGVVGSGLNFGLQGILPFMGYSVGKHLEKLYPNDKYVAQEVSQRYINNVSQRIEKSLSKYIDVDKIIVPTKGDIDLQYRKLDTITQILQLDGVAVGGRVLDIPEANMADLSAIKKNIMGETMDKLYDGKEVQLGELEDVLFKAKEALKEHGLEITSNKIYPTPVTALVDEKISVGIEPTETDLKAVAIEFENGTGAIEEVIDKTTSQVDNQITSKLRSDTKIEDLDGRKVGYTIEGKKVEGVVQGDVLKLSDEFGGRAIPITPEVKQNIIKTADILEGVTREIPVEKAEAMSEMPQEKVSIDKKYRTPNEIEPKIMEKLGIDAGDEQTMKDMERVNFEMANREKNKAQQEITKRQIEIYDRQKELQKEIQMVSEYFSDTDVKEKYKLLWKHVDKRNWELPEILGKGKSIFGKKGDVIISEYFGGDEVAAQKFIDDYRAMVQKRKDLNAEKIQLDREMITLERSRPIDELSGFGEEKVSRFFERTKKDKYDIGHLVDENGNVTEKSVLYIESKVKGSEQNANYLADTNYDVALEVANGDRHSKDVFLDIKVGLEVAKREYEAGNIEVAGEITERLSLEGTKAGKLIKALDNGGSQFQPDKVIRQVVRSRLKNAGGMNEVKKVTRSVKEGIMKAIKIDKKTFNSILDKYTC